jgi:hypothetical protein
MRAERYVAYFPSQKHRGCADDLARYTPSDASHWLPILSPEVLQTLKSHHSVLIRVLVRV